MMWIKNTCHDRHITEKTTQVLIINQFSVIQRKDEDAYLPFSDFRFWKLHLSSSYFKTLHSVVQQHDCKLGVFSSNSEVFLANMVFFIFKPNQSTISFTLVVCECSCSCSRFIAVKLHVSVWRLFTFNPYLRINRKNDESDYGWVWRCDRFTLCILLLSWMLLQLCLHCSLGHGFQTCTVGNNWRQTLLETTKNLKSSRFL